jgi:hypothetical protein
MAFPGDAGRVCFVRTDLVAPENMQVDHVVVCQGAGVATKIIPVGARQATPALPMRMAPNASGDAAVVVGPTLYVFDGETESVNGGAPARPQDGGGTVLSMGAGGHTCLAHTWNIIVQSRIYVVKADPTGATSEAVQIFTFGFATQPPRITVATDANGHCFVTAHGTQVVHDATVDGLWSLPFAYAADGNGSRALAGAAHQAFLTTGARDGFLKLYNRLPSLP